MRWPFKRKMMGTSLTAIESKHRRLTERKEDKIRNLQIKEIKSKLKSGGMQSFNTYLTVPMAGKQAIVKALDKVADEMQQRKFTIDELKQNLIQNKVAKDDFTATVQVE